MCELIDEDTENAELFAGGDKTGMKGRAYGVVSTQEVVDWQTHLNDEEKRKLKELLDQNYNLFDRKLGLYPKKKLHVKLKENTEPMWQKPFPIPYRHEKIFAAEVDEI